MKFVLYTNVLSPHQLPLARELVKRLGPDEFRYVYTDETDADHAALKFDLSAESWVIPASNSAAQSWLESADTLLSGLRSFDLFERRAMKGLKNLYMSERWFKPPVGMFRLLHPKYLGYARRLVSLAKSDAVTLLPIGVHARKDFARIGIPESLQHLWGYFVAPSTINSNNQTFKHSNNSLRVLWCGRPLAWKRLDTVQKAVVGLENVTLDAYSNLSLSEVRAEMHRHDVLVLASNAYEGWGAIVNEALEEGLPVVGTFEAGASGTILPRERLFHAGDWKALRVLLLREMRHELPPVTIGGWTAARAAECLLTGGRLDA